jgi:hypothetical protein
MRGTPSSGARLLVASMLIACIGAGTSHAADPTIIAQGTILLPAIGGTNPEVLQFTHGGCVGSSPNAVFTAFLDVRAYQGRTLRFTATGYDAGAARPGWFIVNGTVCAPTNVGGSTVTTSDSVQWTNTSPFLAINFGQPAVNAHYTVEAL